MYIRPTRFTAQPNKVSHSRWKSSSDEAATKSETGESSTPPENSRGSGRGHMWLTTNHSTTTKPPCQPRRRDGTRHHAFQSGKFQRTGAELASGPVGDEVFTPHRASREGWRNQLRFAVRAAPRTKPLCQPTTDSEIHHFQRPGLKHIPLQNRIPYRFRS